MYPYGNSGRQRVNDEEDNIGDLQAASLDNDRDSRCLVLQSCEIIGL